MSKSDSCLPKVVHYWEIWCKSKLTNLQGNKGQMSSMYLEPSQPVCVCALAEGRDQRGQAVASTPGFDSNLI